MKFLPDDWYTSLPQRSPLRSSTTASTHLSSKISSISSQPSFRLATSGASKWIGGSFGNRDLEGEGDVSGVFGEPGVLGLGCVFRPGVTTGNMYRNFRAAAHKRRLSVRLKVQPRFPFSFSSFSRFSAAACSSATMSWIASLLMYPQGLRERRTAVLYAVQRIWPEERLWRNAFRSEEDARAGRSVTGKKFVSSACVRPEGALKNPAEGDMKNKYLVDRS